MSNPYDQLPPSAFWRPAVAERHFSEIGPLWAPKFDIRPDQHVAWRGNRLPDDCDTLMARVTGWV